MVWALQHMLYWQPAGPESSSCSTKASSDAVQNLQRPQEAGKQHDMGHTHMQAASLEGAADDAARSTAAATRRKPALADRVKQLASRKLKPQEVLMRDKIGFFLGVVNLW